MARRLTGQQTFAYPASWYGRNLLINGDGVIAQRATTITAATVYANNDDAYCLDRWVFLSELASDAADISKDTTEYPYGARCSIKMEVTAAGAATPGKFGICQIVESENCRHLFNTDGSSHVSLSFWAQKNISISSVGAAVLSWGNTADTVTSDVMGTWGASGAAPTFATDWTLESSAAAAASVGVGGTWSRFVMEGIPIDAASTENLAVVIYANDTDSLTAGNALWISNVMLNAGKRALPFVVRSFREELADCQRYFWTSYNHGTAVGTATDVGRIEHSAARNIDFAAGQPVWDIRFPVPMRTTPVGEVYSTGVGTAARVTGSGEYTAEVINEGMSGMTVREITDDPAAAAISFHAVADAEL